MPDYVYGTNQQPWVTIGISALFYKISQSGMNSLTDAEHKELLNASRKNDRNDSPK